MSISSHNCNRPTKIFVKQRECKRIPLARGEANFNQIFQVYKKQAKNRNFIFNLSKDEFRQLTSQECNYCGDTFTNTNSNSKNGDFKYNGIDRVDNTKGYTVDNCVSCCKVCNKMKSSMRLNDFLVQIEKIYCYFNPVNWIYDEEE